MAGSTRRIKNARTVNYRIHSRMVGGRWVRDQEAHIVRLSEDIVKVSWDEPTGTTVSVSVDFAARRLHGVIFFPRWIAQNPGDDFVHVARVRNGFTSRLRDAVFKKFRGLDRDAELSFVNLPQRDKGRWFVDTRDCPGNRAN